MARIACGTFLRILKRNLDNAVSSFHISGDALIVQDLSTPINIGMNIPMQPEQSYICKFWNDDIGEWSTDGVLTQEHRNEDIVECQTSHLSIFVVVIVDRVFPSSTMVSTSQQWNTAGQTVEDSSNMITSNNSTPTKSGELNKSVT